MLTSFNTLLITCCLFFSLTTHAQNVQGVWKGYTAVDYQGWAEMDGTYILQLQQTAAGQYTGTAWFYENAQLYGELTITGRRNDPQNNWIFKETKVNSITLPKSYHTSLGEISVQLFDIDGEIVLQGSIVSYSSYSPKVHARRFIRLSKLSDAEITALRLPGSGKPVGRIAIDSIHPTWQDTPVIQTAKRADTIQQNKPVINTAKRVDARPVIAGNKPKPAPDSAGIALNSRKNRLQGSYQISSPGIDINLYDYGTIDHDTVTVFFNGNKMADRQELTAKPLHITLTADPGREYQELILHANNLGDIPPNTAKMIIMTSDKRYELSVSSSETENAMIRFRYIPETKTH